MPDSAAGPAPASTGPSPTGTTDAVRAAAAQFHPTGHYLNTASCGLPPDVAWSALERAWHAFRHGEVDVPGFDAVVDGARADFARLVGAPVGTVATGSQVSVMLGTVATALAGGTLHAPTGEPGRTEIVVADGDFTSVTFPFAAAPQLRVREVPLADIADAVDRRTAAVAVSAVQSADGRLADLAAITAACRERGALSVVDLTQAAGWLPVRATDADITVCGGYKWLLAPRGTAFLTIAELLWDLVPPTGAGWYAGADRWSSIYGLPLRLAPDARRFDVSPAWHSWVGAAPALTLLADLGAPAIRAHDVALADSLLDGLGLPPAGSAIVSLPLLPGAAERVAAAGISAAVRAGRLRLSFHLYSTEQDVSAALDALDGYVAT